MLASHEVIGEPHHFSFHKLSTTRLKAPVVAISNGDGNDHTISKDAAGGMHIKSAASTRLMSFTNGEELDDCVLRDHIDNTVNAALGAVNAGEIAGLTTAVESLQATVAAQQDYIDALKAWMAALRGLLAPSPLDFTDLV